MKLIYVITFYNNSSNEVIISIYVNQKEVQYDGKTWYYYVFVFCCLKIFWKPIRVFLNRAKSLIPKRILLKILFFFIPFETITLVFSKVQKIQVHNTTEL